MNIAFAHLSFAQTVINSDRGWDFAGEKQPKYLTLLNMGKENLDAGCSGRLDFLYENYAKLYPEFRPLMNDENLQKQWRKSLILNGSDNIQSFNLCLFLELSKQWKDAINIKDSDKLLFCGVKANNLSKEDSKIADIIEELTYYAIKGQTGAIRIMLDTDPKYDRVRLNDDVRYYLQLLFDELTPKQGELRDIVQKYLTPSAGDNLPNADRKFVKDAFKKKDFSLILKNTNPC